MSLRYRFNSRRSPDPRVAVMLEKTGTAGASMATSPSAARYGATAGTIAGV